MINRRRDFLKNSLMSAGLMASINSSGLAVAPSKPPMRFIFMHRGNGLWPRVCAPPSLDPKTLEKENRKEAIDIDLDSHDLPEWMDPLSEHKANLTILQGLSGMMCVILVVKTCVETHASPPSAWLSKTAFRTRMSSVL